MQIIDVEDDAIHTLRHLSAARGGGSAIETLEIKRARTPLNTPPRLPPM
jgi:hypothetical protein